MAETDLQTDFVGRRWRLFGLALRTSVLTVLSVGIYRFWMKTRLRRYYWSSIRPGGVPLEYTGEPMEKLLGFLIAVVFLSFYIGIVNLILMFLSFSILHGNFAAYLVSFIGVIPFLFYARYRARRFLLARTRWRGLRFGLEPGALGYTWRAMLHWVLTIVTVGLLWPRMTFKLEKYRTDRTFYGTARMSQGGGWTMLFRPLVPLIIGVIVSVGAGIGVLGGQIIALWAIAPGLLLVIYGFVHYRVQSFRLLANEKTAGGVGLISAPRTWRVLRIYVFGWLLIGIVITLLLLAFGAALALYMTGVIQGADLFASLTALAARLPSWLTALVAALLYFTVFVFWGVLTQVFLTLPLMRHYAETLTITGGPHLAQIKQRPRDEFAEAEGFAEALDVGAAL